MTLTYKKAYSSEKPELIDTTSSKTTVYIRQNIIEQTDENGYSYYEYDECKLTKEQYKLYEAELNSTKTLESIEALKSENQSLKEQVNMLSMCILELSQQVYT